MNDEDSAFSIKDLITIVPLAGIVLAAMYDWGFFNSVDPSLFTLFSWGDHIVFALEALLPAIVIVAAIGWSLSRYTFDVPLNKQPRARLWFLVVLFTVFTLGAIGARGYDMAVYWVVMILIALSGMFWRIGLAGMILGFSLGMIAGAYLIGYSNARTALHSPEVQSVFMEKGELHGRIVRSGERGILFYDRATNKISYMLWSDVKRVEAVLANQIC